MFTDNNQAGGGMPSVPSLSKNAASFGTNNQTQPQNSIFSQQGQNQNNQTNAGQAASSPFATGNNQAFNFGGQKSSNPIFGGNNNANQGSANQGNANPAFPANTANTGQGGQPSPFNQANNKGTGIFNTTQGTSPFAASNKPETQQQGGNTFMQGK